jgi:hypothetical protein
VTFLQGLSRDELAYIADFLGACILESTDRLRCTRAQLAMRISEFERFRSQRSVEPRTMSMYQDHQMILLLEYLCQTGFRQLPTPAGHA